MSMKWKAKHTVTATTNSLRCHKKDLFPREQVLFSALLILQGIGTGMWKTHVPAVRPFGLHYPWSLLFQSSAGVEHSGAIQEQHICALKIHHLVDHSRSHIAQVHHRDLAVPGQQ